MSIGRIVFRALCQALAWVASWVGIVFLAKDASELPEAFSAWGVPLVPPDRETLLIVFSGALVCWVVWRDLRPVLRERWPSYFKTALSIEFDPENTHARYWRPGKRHRPDGLLAAEGMGYYIRVVNNTKKTIRDVRGELTITASGRNSGLEFSRGDGGGIDIAPGSGEFALLFLLTSGVDDPSALVVRVHGLDVPEVRKTFFLYPDRVPALSEKAPL